MKVNFEKSDRLIELLEDSCLALDGFFYWGAYQMKNSVNPRIQELYSELAKITQGNESLEEKHSLRIKAYAKAYNHEGDLKFGEKALFEDFDEDKIVKRLTRSYWQIQTGLKFKDESGNNFTDKESFLKVIEKWSPNEINKGILVEVISNQEPTVRDIENEFWENCTDTTKINDWCNIYRERFNGHLKEIDIEKFENDLFEDGGKFREYFKDLRITGLLLQKDREMEIELFHIARQINSVSSNIVKLFKGLSRSGLMTSELGVNPENNNKEVRNGRTTQKVSCITESNQEKLTKIHAYCNDSFGDISLIDFLGHINSANFIELYKNKNTVKCKLKYAIYVISKIIDDSEWYKTAASSIGSTPSGCSGAGATDDWKKELRKLANIKL